MERKKTVLLFLLPWLFHCCLSVDPVDLAFNVIDPKGSSTEKAPVIFMHGILNSKDYWGDIPSVVANATKRKVYAIDARNHCDSPWSDDFSFVINALDLLHFMDKQGIQKAILVGHSMGGVTGIKVALKEPERVEKLVVVDQGVNSTVENTKGIQAGVSYLLRLTLQGLESAPKEIEDEYGIKKYMKEYFMKKLPGAMAQQISVLLSPNDTTLLILRRSEDGRFTHKHNLKVLIKAINDIENLTGGNVGLYEGPVTFICGTASPLEVFKQEEDVKELFPKVKFVLIQNGTHDLSKEYPEEFIAVVVDFITKE